MTDWQDAVAKVIGAKRCSMTERRRAFQLLHDTGIGYRIGGKVEDTLRHMVASGEIEEEQESEQREET